ncbi:MAG: hypothetical protein J6D03_09735 [Clostridia bacterium]|nr:hypothetical protein [Clostridia bacterium]
MSKSKLTLIVDGNWLLMSRKSVINNRFSNDKELIKELKVLMIKSLNVVLRTFPSIDNIMFVSDGGSWRNTIEPPKFLKKSGVEYKGNRVQDPETDWKVIFDGYHDLLDTLKQCGINVYREQGIEGDDWCWYLSTILNNEGTNCIIWTRDHDLMQLVKTNSDGCFTAWYEKESGLYVEKKADEDINFLFNMNFNINESLMNELVSNSTKVTSIDPNTIVIDKIIRGDSGDNILPIVKHKGRTSEKEFRVANKEIDFTMNPFDNDNIKTWIENLVETKPYLGRIVDNKSVDEIIEHFKYNRQLVCLNERIYPKDVYSIMCSYLDYECCCNIKPVEEILEAQKNDVESIINDIF